MSKHLENWNAKETKFKWNKIDIHSYIWKIVQSYEFPKGPSITYLKKNKKEQIDYTNT